jgi:hypothetical protein
MFNMLKKFLFLALPLLVTIAGSGYYIRESRYAIKTKDEGGIVLKSDIRKLQDARLLDWETRKEVHWVPTAPRTLVIFLSGAECPSCLDEFRVWQQLATVFPRRQLEVVAVLVRATPNDAAALVQSVKPKFRVLLDEYNEAQAGVRIPQSTPFKVLLNENGRPLLAEGPASMATMQTDFGGLVAKNVNDYVERGTRP